jgi:hypothetical protein
LVFSNSPLKRHPDYRKAKAGDFRAALNLISDLVWLEINQYKGFAKDCIFVAARESTGDNAIPQVMAEIFALVCGATADRALSKLQRCTILAQTLWSD